MARVVYRKSEKVADFARTLSAAGLGHESLKIKSKHEQVMTSPVY